MVYFIFRIVHDHRQDPFSLLHCFWVLPSGVTALAVNAVLGVPMVLSLPGGDTVRLRGIAYGGMKSFIHRALIRSCCRRADRVVMLTRYQAAIAREHGVRIRDVRIIPFGVDLTQFFYQPLPLSLPLRLISIGTINRVKDVFLQVETFVELRRQIDCRFTIVGQDDLGGEVRRYAESLHVGDLIEWKGYCAHDGVAALLHGAHVLIHTAQYEAEGVVLLEAFASGTLAAGTRVGLLADCDESHDCTIDFRDPAALASVMLAMIRDPERAARLREKQRAYAEHHTIDRTAADYAALYREIAPEA